MRRKWLYRAAINLIVGPIVFLVLNRLVSGQYTISDFEWGATSGVVSYCLMSALVDSSEVQP